ncbi:double-stranded RNA-specific adenosine deaminase [Nephila pilipes]|uniref:Double-stranded RNA-specific adenosine deaminase n=1 Tax=Nephila pilipes TaxID=299642 RepID=A0A8X6I7Q3_NEPPI|nr:double-stranded RNA-specific adenosine deaminase [Nephila pilipes]
MPPYRNTRHIPCPKMTPRLSRTERIPLESKGYHISSLPVPQLIHRNRSPRYLQNCPTAKKVVNSVLYNLRSEGILQNVVKSPPVWRVNEKLYDRYNQTPVVPDVTAYHYTLKDESVMHCITKNNNFSVLSSVENNKSNPMYVKEQLVAYHTVVSSSTSEEFCQSFSGRQITAPTWSLQNARNITNPSVFPSKPAEAVLNILL